MNGKRLSPASSLSAIALHDYARTRTSGRPGAERAERSATTSYDPGSGHVAAVPGPEDGYEIPHNLASRTRKVPTEPLGTAVSAKAISKREPLPMKLRALPRSFWEQPNTNQSPSPGYLFAPLPPLTREEGISEGSDSQSGGVNRSFNSTSSPSNGVEFLPSTSPDRGVVSPADTDLLFSLFRAVEKHGPAKKPSTVRRGRPRRGSGTQLPHRQVRDDDPYLVSSVTERHLPTLSGTQTSFSPREVLKTVSLRSGPGSGNEGQASGVRKVALPCLQANPSYSQILSELVVKL